MFLDELERLDKALNRVAILHKRRLRAYHEFRDQSEPVERIAHSDPPNQIWPSAYWPVNTEVCSICGQTFSNRSEHRTHFAEHREPRSAAAPIGMAAAPCRPAAPDSALSPQLGPAPHPIFIAGCTIAQVVEVMKRVGIARARMGA